MRGHKSRIWLYRLLAILLGIAPWVATELALRWMNYPQRPPAVDPFVDLHNLKPLFEADTNDPEVLRISNDRLNLFRPASFKREKSADSIRVFALGGSTTQGEPYSTETAFATWFGLCLQAATGLEVEVVNCGGLSYASYRVLAILKEVITYEPDLIVVYTGHNEYLERRSYEGYRKGGWPQRLAAGISRMRLVQLGRKFLGKDGQRPEPLVENPTQLKAEVDALLDYQGGLRDYVRGALSHDAVRDHFRWNISEMERICRDQDVPLLIIRPVSNLLDCPPFKFEEDSRLSGNQLNEFRRNWDLAREADSPEVSRPAVQAALAIDPQHAGANYLLGKLQFAANEIAPARQSLMMAKDNDVCPLRAPTAIVEAVTSLAENKQLPYVDAEALFRNHARRGIVGADWLVDHVHPSIEGHQLLGMEISEACLAAGLFTSHNNDWRERAPELFESHIQKLGEEYFHRGQQRLEGLMLWTQGRASKIRQP